MGCCLVGCVRLLVFALWRAIFAALIAIILARIDAYIEGRHSESLPGRAWRRYRGQGKTGVRRGTPPDASGAIDTSGRPRP